MRGLFLFVLGTVSLCCFAACGAKPDEREIARENVLKEMAIQKPVEKVPAKTQQPPEKVVLVKPATIEPDPVVPPPEKPMTEKPVVSEPLPKEPPPEKPTPTPVQKEQEKPAQPKQPDYPKEISGKNLDQWIADIASKDRSKSERAIQTIVMLGPPAKKAVPTLVAELKKHRPVAGVVLDMGVRSKAIVALGGLVPLIDNTQSEEVQEALTEMLKMLDDPQVALRYRAIQAISNLGPVALKGVPKLIKLSEDLGSWETRQVACLSLGMIVPVDKKLGPDNKLALAALYKALLNDPASQVRVSAIQALNRLGAGQFAASLPVFEKDMELAAAKDPDPLVKLAANMSLMGIKKNKDGARRTVIGNLLYHDDNLIRVEAVTALSSLGPDAVDQLDKLVAGMSDRDPNVAVLCMATLGRIGPTARAALPFLDRIVADEKQLPMLRETAMDAGELIRGKKLLEKKTP